MGGGVTIRCFRVAFLRRLKRNLTCAFFLHSGIENRSGTMEMCDLCLISGCLAKNHSLTSFKTLFGLNQSNSTIFCRICFSKVRNFQFAVELKHVQSRKTRKNEKNICSRCWDSNTEPAVALIHEWALLQSWNFDIRKEGPRFTPAI